MADREFLVVGSFAKGATERRIKEQGIVAEAVAPGVDLLCFGVFGGEADGRVGELPGDTVVAAAGVELRAAALAVW